MVEERKSDKKEQDQIMKELEDGSTKTFKELNKDFDSWMLALDLEKLKEKDLVEEFEEKYRKKK